MLRVPVLASVFLAFYATALKTKAPVAPKVKITKPNVDDDHMKATKAIAKYEDSSKGTLEVWDDVKATKTVGPGSYPAQIDNLIKSQKESIEVIGKMKDAAQKASDLASQEQKDAEKTYGDKEAALGKGSIGDDFVAAAGKLKTK